MTARPVHDAPQARQTALQAARDAEPALMCMGCHQAPATRELLMPDGSSFPTRQFHCDMGARAWGWHQTRPISSHAGAAAPDTSSSSSGGGFAASAEGGRG